MGDGYGVDVEQIRAHARKIDALRERFGAVKSASSHIAQDDQAYGQLCGWISGVLEARHTRQDELLAYAEENLSLAAESLRATADDYEALEDENAGRIGSVGGGAA